MNKKFIIPLVSFGVVLGSAASILLANQKQTFSQLKAGDSLTPHTITLTKDDVFDPETGDSYLIFDLLQENATRSGKDFSIEFNYVNSSGNQIITGGDYIFTTTSESNNVSFGLNFVFENVAEYVGITLNGTFRESGKDYDTTSFSIPPEDLSSGSYYYQKYQLKYATLDSIVIEYKCA